MIHYLKVWPQFIPALVDGSKTFELRKDDRAYAVGDLLHLHEWHDDVGAHGQWTQERQVTYKLSGPSWGILDGFCVLGLSPVAAPRCEMAKMSTDIPGFYLATKEGHRMGVVEYVNDGKSPDHWRDVNDNRMSTSPRAYGYTLALIGDCVPAVAAPVQVDSAIVCRFLERLRDLAGHGYVTSWCGVDGVYVIDGIWSTEDLRAAILAALGERDAP